MVAGCWQEFATVLAAPQHYLTDVAQGVFNHKIPFETIGQAIEAHGDPARIACKLKLLDCAIAKVHHERPKKHPALIGGVRTFLAKLGFLGIW